MATQITPKSSSALAPGATSARPYESSGAGERELDGEMRQVSGDPLVQKVAQAVEARVEERRHRFHQRHARRGAGRLHLVQFRHVQRDGRRAKDMFASLSCAQYPLPRQANRRREIHTLDVGIVEQRLG